MQSGFWGPYSLVDVTMNAKLIAVSAGLIFAIVGCGSSPLLESRSQWRERVKQEQAEFREEVFAANRQNAQRQQNVVTSRNEAFNQARENAAIECQPELDARRYEQYALCTGAIDARLTRQYYPNNTKFIAARARSAELKIGLYQKIDRGELTKVEADRLLEIGYNRILAGD